LVRFSQCPVTCYDLWLCRARLLSALARMSYRACRDPPAPPVALRRDDRRAHCLGFDSQHAGRNGETRTMRIRRSEAMPLWKRHASAAAAADQHEEAVTPRWRHAKRPSMRLWHASWNMNADHALKHASLDIMDWNTQDSVAEHTRRGMRGHGATVRHGGVIPWRHRRSGAS